MPLVEYVSFMLNMNNSLDVKKLQRLQNRALRMCFDVKHPRDMGITEMHILARVDLLQHRRDLNLLCIMYDMKQHHAYERIGTRITRQGNKYTFKTEIPTVGIYTRSPYYIGAYLWNNLPNNVQNATTKTQFKSELKAFWARN